MTCYAGKRKAKSADRFTTASERHAVSFVVATFYKRYRLDIPVNSGGKTDCTEFNVGDQFP